MRRPIPLLFCTLLMLILPLLANTGPENSFIELCSGEIISWAEYLELRKEARELEADLELSKSTFQPPAMSPVNSTIGAWSAKITLPIIPHAIANLPNGMVLTWASKREDYFGGNSGQTYTALFDPLTNTAVKVLVTKTDHDMFCPGVSNLPDGRLLVTGGSSSLKSSIYDPAIDDWVPSNDFNIKRGYHSHCTMPDGASFTIGGSWSGGLGGKHAEIWRPETGWVHLTGLVVDPIIVGTGDPDGIYREDNHAWLWVASDGKVFHAGPGKEMHWFDVSGVGSYTTVGNRGDDDYAMCGNTVMFDIGKILKTGGSTSYSKNTASLVKSYVIDISSPPAATVTRVQDMSHARTYHNSVVLPNGKVFVVGGHGQATTFDDSDAKLTPELFDPATNTFTQVAAMTVPRTYHSAAVLMLDGRVIVGGGGLCDDQVNPDCSSVNHPDVEIYYPPYLFDGANMAVRPVLDSVPTTGHYNSNIEVLTDSPVTDFSFIRMSTATHATNNEQRRVPITPTDLGNNTYRLAIPNANLMPPGYYMLFALNSNGTPSEGRVIKIAPDPSGVSACNLISDESFETGEGMWNGTSGAVRDMNFPSDGMYSFKLADRTSSFSKLTSNLLDLSALTELTIDFNYYATGFEFNESFRLQMRTDATASFQNVMTWRQGIDFFNNVPYSEQVVINGPFTQTMELRFVGHGSTDDGDDHVYLDEIMLTGCEEPVTVKATIKLQGPWKTAAKMGRLPRGTVPATDPYMGTKVYVVPDEAVDWVMVEILDPMDPNLVLGTQTCFVRTDGVLINAFGEEKVEFPGISVTTGYVKVQHRNHLCIMTNEPVDFTL